MAYVRQRGRQIAIVHGTRTPGKRNVEQHVIFTLYSREEALEFLEGPRSRGIHRLLERRNPELSLDWDKIHQGIRDSLSFLPEKYDLRSDRGDQRFRKSLADFARHLVLADPGRLESPMDLVAAHLPELEFLSDLVNLRQRQQTAPRPEDQDGPWFWGLRLQGRDVPPEVEKLAESYLAQGRADKARAAFRLLVQMFPDYAEGLNFLGLIELEQGDGAAAEQCFLDTVETARRLIPPTRRKGEVLGMPVAGPYLRGLRNLALTRNQLGKWAEAVQTAGLLKQAGDHQSAAVFAAAAYLNMGAWSDCLRSGEGPAEEVPSLSLILAFAAFEAGLTEDAATFFIHGAMHHPAAARALVDPSARSAEDQLAHHLRTSLSPYLSNPRRLSRIFLWRVLTSRDAAESFSRDKGTLTLAEARETAKRFLTARP